MIIEEVVSFGSIITAAITAVSTLLSLLLKKGSLTSMHFKSGEKEFAMHLKSHKEELDNILELLIKEAVEHRRDESKLSKNEELQVILRDMQIQMDEIRKEALNSVASKKMTDNK